MTPGLAKPLKLAELLGNPQSRLQFIHVAGTNGKGSTCAFLESIYREHGLRVGLYTSPHLVRFGERIQVNRTPIDESEVIRLTEKVMPLCAQFPSEDRPTFFEVVTAMALVHFAEQRCDLVIWETGLGGRLDATNIVRPLASVITSIGKDHEQWLGSTLTSIAREKAGIIKSQIPTLTTVTESEPLEVIRQTARTQASPLIEVDESRVEETLKNISSLPLLGQHQRRNAALAWETVRCLRSQWNIADSTCVAGLEKARWPGRFQIHKEGERIWILDGAHNPEGTQALQKTFCSYFPNQTATLIVGMLRDKHPSIMLEHLMPVANRVILTPVQSHRSLTSTELRDLYRNAKTPIQWEIYESLSEAIRSAPVSGIVLIAGSLYLIGEALEILRLSSSPQADERSLNEWSPRPLRLPL